jgi:hypothetical protein
LEEILMDAIWRTARYGRTIHAYAASGLIDVPLCGAFTPGPFFNGYPAPPAAFERVRHCQRCVLALGRQP